MGVFCVFALLRRLRFVGYRSDGVLVGSHDMGMLEGVRQSVLDSMSYVSGAGLKNDKVEMQ